MSELPTHGLPDQQPVSLRHALDYVAPYWRRLLAVLGLSLASTGLTLYLPLLSRTLVDEALLGGDTAALRRVVGLFALLTLSSFGLNVASGLRYTRVSAEILFDMRLAVYRRLQQLSPRFYARTRLGEIMSRVNNDISEIQRVAAEAALAWVGNVLFLVGTLGLLLWLDARLLLISVLPLPVSLWALVRYRRQLEGRVKLMRERGADIGSFLIETIQGMKLVVTSNAQDREIARFRAKNDGFIAALMSMQRLTYLSGGVPGLVLSVGTAIVFLYGGSRVIAGAMTLGTLVAFMAYQMRLLPPIQALMGLYTSLATARVSLGRVQQVLGAVVDVVDRPDARPLVEVRGDVRFEAATVDFDRGGPALESVTLAIAAGQVLAVVGPSGSGKSTLADLLLRLLDPDAGRVLLDGHDLRSLRLRDLRRHVVLVDQEPFVFHASIAENIRYARPLATRDEVVASAQAAGIHDFVVGLPHTYDTTVGERGLALSAGERQRIAVARAFLADPAVLVLDEATAALDPGSERQVIRGYEALMRGRTTILITHRLELARQADRVAVLDGARLVEQGEPESLLRRGGAFAALFAPGGASTRSDDQRSQAGPVRQMGSSG